MCVTGHGYHTLTLTTRVTPKHEMDHPAQKSKWLLCALTWYRMGIMIMTPRSPIQCHGKKIQLHDP